MAKLTVICDNININANIHSVRFIVPAKPVKDDKNNPRTTATTIVQMNFSDHDHIKDFEANKMYEISIEEVAAKKIAPFKK